LLQYGRNVHHICRADASSGEDAVKAFKEASKDGKPFGAFAMELALPCGISGLEATIAIKQIDAEATHS